MKCQECDQPATHHVTEIVSGKVVEYHVCDTHAQNLEGLKPFPGRDKPVNGIGAFLGEPDLRDALKDGTVQEKIAAHLLPALCLALVDQEPKIRIAAAYRLMRLGSFARSAAGALNDALQDEDGRVRKAAEIALEHIQTETGEKSLLFL